MSENSTDQNQSFSSTARDEAIASLRAAQVDYDDANREYAHLQNAVTALLSLHNVTATQKKLEIKLSLGSSDNQDQSLLLNITQTPDRGVGGLLWQSSIVLAENLGLILNSLNSSLTNDGNTLPVSDPVVIELGAGVAALPSLAAVNILKSNATVIASDTPDIVPLMQCCWNDNNFSLNSVGRKVQMVPLLWGQCSETNGSIDGHASDSNQNLPQADVLMGADILYAERLYQDLIWTINSLLKPDGVLVLTYAERDCETERLFFISLHHQTGIQCTRYHNSCVRDDQTIHTFVGRRSTSDSNGLDRKCDQACFDTGKLDTEKMYSSVQYSEGFYL